MFDQGLKGVEITWQKIPEITKCKRSPILSVRRLQVSLSLFLEETVLQNHVDLLSVFKPALVNQ